MPKPIFWSSFAEKDLIGIVGYLLENWNPQIALQYLDLVDEFVRQIGDQPKIYPLINKRLRIRKCVLTKQNSLYYREHTERIEILRIYDNRRNPFKLKFNKE